MMEKPLLGFFPNQEKPETVTNPHLKTSQSEILREVNGKQYSILLNRMAPSLLFVLKMENGQVWFITTDAQGFWKKMIAFV